MKKSRLLKVLAVAAVLILNVALISTACAGTSTENGTYVSVSSIGEDWYAQLNELPPFKFEKHRDGIGFGTCPVYTAPSEDAYRCANGKASCDTNSEMDDAFFVSDWLLVRYKTNNDVYRVGYIPSRYVKGFKSNMFPHFGYIPAVADDDIYVTDNPMIHGTSFAMLAEGEEFHILSRYDYHKDKGLEWWYIECEVDGQLAYGFIELYSGFHLGSAAGY